MRYLSLAILFANAAPPLLLFAIFEQFQSICNLHGALRGDRPYCSAAMVSKSHIAIVIAAVVSVIASIDALAQSAQTEHPINSFREIRAGLRACWISPTMRTPPQVTVRLSLKRNGEILGQPFISYESPEASEDERTTLQAAVAAAVARCIPLPISDALGGIIAGDPIHMKLGEGWRRKKGAPDSSTRKIGLAEFSDECSNRFEHLSGGKRTENCHKIATGV